jgi:hypothetical protein
VPAALVPLAKLVMAAPGRGPGAGGSDASASRADVGTSRTSYFIFGFVFKLKNSHLEGTTMRHGLFYFLLLCEECKYCSCCLVAGCRCVGRMHVLGVFGNLLLFLPGKGQSVSNYETSRTKGEPPPLASVPPCLPHIV